MEVVWLIETEIIELLAAAPTLLLNEVIQYIAISSRKHDGYIGETNKSIVQNLWKISGNTMLINRFQ